MVIDDQKIGGLEATLDHILAVQIGQRIQGGGQQVAHLAGGQGPTGENLSEILFRKIRHDEQKVVPPELATARVEKADQMRMRQRCNRFPMSELRLRDHWVGGHDLDRGLGDGLRRALGEKYHTVV